MGIDIELFMNAGRVDHYTEGVQDRRNTDWFLDRHLKQQADILEHLNRLASEVATSEFRKSLYDALLLYSRQSLASEISDKIVSTTSALESMLLNALGSGAKSKMQRPS